MKKVKNQKVILSFEDILSTYQTKIQSKQFKRLNLRRWLPIIENSKFAKTNAYLIGKTMGDGHLDKNFIVSFVGNEKEIINLKKLILRNYGLKDKNLLIKYKEALGSSFILRINDTLFGRMLFCLGAPKGNKTKQRFLVPNWIYNSKENSKLFLQGLLEDELTTIKIEKSNYSVMPRLKMAKEEKLLNNLKIFLKQLSYLLKKFDVTCGDVTFSKTHKENQKTRELYLSINRNKQNILNFAKNIGFKLNTRKIKSLHKCVKILEKTKYNRKPFIDTQKIVKLRKEGLSIRQISNIVNLNRTSVHRVLLKNIKCGGRDLNLFVKTKNCS